MNKIEHAKRLLQAFQGPAALLCSFGKDSIVLLHLIRETLPRNKMSCHAYPVPVVYHRSPYFPAKHEFADSIIRSWDLEVHDYPPLACGIKCKEDRLELVARYPFGLSAIDLPINTEAPEPRRNFVCGVEWLERPKQIGLSWPWRTMFIGHKSSDVDPYEGALPLRHDAANVGTVALVFPLRHWTDDDVWDYIEANNVPYDTRRYDNRKALPDTWLNPDYLPACTACIDPRDNAKEVFCPKLGAPVPNIGGKVLRLDETPEYVNKEKAA